MAEKLKYETPKFEVKEPDVGGNTGLPFGLCKKYGIQTQKDWTPRDAWNALKGELGVDPEDVYKELENNKTEVKQAEKQIKKEEIISWAKDKSISIKDDLFKKMPETIAAEQAQKFIELYEKFPTKRNGEMFFEADKLSNIVTARAEYTASTDSIGIKLNTNAFIKDYKQEVADNTKSGWWGQIPENNYKYYAVSHEYGHLIEYSVLSKKDFNKILRQRLPQTLDRYGYSKSALQKMTTDLRKELFYDELMPQIFAKAKEYDSSIVVPKNITNTGYKTAPSVSGYAARSWSEYFAESFAVGILGGDNPIGKATVDVVKNYFGEKK